MKLLHPWFPNGPFGDPALYVWENNRSRALLFDCGDLSRFSTRQLLRVTHIFLSHCHMDHVFGFDHFLRVHIGTEKSVTILGPPETSTHIGGKLQGYTWNLIQDEKLEFSVIDLDPRSGRRMTTLFRAKNSFHPEKLDEVAWDPKEPILDTGFYQVSTTMLDHRTPSMAYATEEKPRMSVKVSELENLGMKSGNWLQELKRYFLFGGAQDQVIEVPMKEGGSVEYRVSELSRRLLVPKPRQKIAYFTDGGADPENWVRLLELIGGADLVFGESCFVREQERQARETKHFTADYVGRLAKAAHVKAFAPFHFSKRYLGKPELVRHEIAREYSGELIELRASQPRERL